MSEPKPHGTGTGDHLFVDYHVGDEPEVVYRKAVQSATEMLWLLGAAEDALAAIYDVLTAAGGAAGVRAALVARMTAGQDAAA
jgi:hypothetical protein